MGLNLFWVVEMEVKKMERLVKAFQSIRETGLYKNPEEMMDDIINEGVLSSEEYIVHTVVISETKIAIVVDDLIDVVFRGVVEKKEVEKAVNEAWK